MKRAFCQGLYRGLGPALLASAALHGALAGLWFLWPAGGPRSLAEGETVAGVIEVVIAALPEAEPPRPESHPGPGPAAESEPTEITPLPVAVIVPPAPPLAMPGAVEAKRPGSAERPARPEARPRSPGVRPNALPAAIQAVESAAGSTPVDPPGLPRAGASESGPEGALAAPGGALTEGPAADLSGAGGAVKPPGYAMGSAANPFPAYPVAARYDGAEGRILLRVRVDVDGKVRGIEIVVTSGHTILDRAATEAVRRWRFEPARADGMTVPGEIDVPIQFRLRG